jgi:hypothetical protein
MGQWGLSPGKMQKELDKENLTALIMLSAKRGDLPMRSICFLPELS